MNSTPRVATCRPLGDGRFGIWCGYENRHGAKALPGARWDPKLGCWWVPNAVSDLAKQFVDELNGSSAPRHLVDALAAVLRLFAPERAERLYKAMAKVCHPDTGGTEEAMKALDEAWRQVKR